MEYQLGTLGPLQFENMVRALWLAAVGPGVTVFGAGSDGGREASYRGSFAMATEERWDGYTVIQAKYRTKEREPEDNLQWLLQQIKAELRHWGDKNSKRVRDGALPDNLIIVSNVSLSSAPGGGIDTANAELKKIADVQKVNLQNWRVWPAQQLSALLDNAAGVRGAYGGFLTPGDVLAQITERLDLDDKELERALISYVTKEMLAARWVTLDSGGGESRDDRVELGHVAVDLPVRRRDDHELPWAMKTLVTHADTVPRHSPDANTAPPHVLLVGGPGQGKSTITGLLAQVYRVALLQGSTTLSGEAQRLHTDLKEILPARGLPVPANRRWPIRVDLAAFAGEISGEMEPSLLKYLAKRIAMRSAADVTAAKLDQWLGRYPWLLVLDGLDEVASSHLRDSVVRAVSEFLVDAGSRLADVVVVATTRPQGYANELDARDYGRLELLELTNGQAVAYADQLARARVPDDLDLRQHIHAAMTDAASNPMTARLIRTPLQVSIMSRLLEHRQRIPQERYALFAAYFDTIYARESNKKGHIAKLLEERRNDVVWVHQRVGLACHVGAESGAAVDASIPREQLQQIVLDRLREEGLDATDAERTAEFIATAALNRLVLLVPQGAGDNVGFEVRSLQEFMAARALTAGDDRAIVEGLRPLVPAAHWRNTWLFAAGFLFSEREHLRSQVIGLLREVEASNALYKLAGVGADLAGDLVYDGLASKSPDRNRALALHAIEEIATSPGLNWNKLARVLQHASDDLQTRTNIVRAIDAALARGGGPRATALLLCHEWEASTGALAGQARQRWTNNPVADVEPGFLIVLHGVSGDLPAGSPSLTTYLSTLLTDTDPARAVVEGLTASQLGQEHLKVPDLAAAESVGDVAWVVGSVAQDSAHLERTLLDANSQKLSTAGDGICQLIDAIAAPDWHIAHTVRTEIQHWLSLRTVDARLLDPGLG